MAAMYLRPAMHSRFALPCTSRRQPLQDPRTESLARALELPLSLVLSLICLQPAARTQQMADSAPTEADHNTHAGQAIEHRASRFNDHTVIPPGLWLQSDHAEMREFRGGVATCPSSLKEKR
jgi:hypothetical protein